MASSKSITVDSQLSTAVNAFGLSLFRQLVQEYPDENIFISPLSVSAALSMAYNGADGDTRKQMKQTLGFSELTPRQINESCQRLFSRLTGHDPNVEMRVANSIWYDVRYRFRDSFIETNHKYFGAEVTPLDFGSATAADIINSWVNRSTNGKISKIVAKPLDTLTVMILINAIYFKGTWTYQFAESRTADDLFLSRSGEKQPIKMMHIRNALRYHETPELQMVDLPYGNGRYSMTIMLPHHEMDINQFVLSLTEERFNVLIARMWTMEGRLALPRFTLEYETSLNKILQFLGMKDAFHPSKADFSEMSNDTGLVISDVKHKTFVEVNEEGTEAAAVTSVRGGLITTSVKPQPFVMIVHRPFVFMIRDRDTNTILFIGRVTGLGA